MSNAFTVSNILMLASWSTIATMLAVVCLAGLTGKHLLAPVQAISHIAFGERAYLTNRLNLTFAAVGFVLNVFTMVGWSVVAELTLQALKVTPSSPFGTFAIAFCISALAYWVDFKVVPKRFTPGFEHVLSRRALYLVYWILAISIGMGSLGRAV
jgi:hypothetical protein